MRTIGPVLVVTVAVLLGSAAAGALELKLTVTEPAGVDRTAEPVSGGIPLPPGQFRKGQTFALFDGGKEVPVQAVPLVVGERGDLRWILLDFQTDLKAGRSKVLVLKDVKGTAAPPSPVKVTETAAKVAVDTGKVTLVISRNKPFGLFESVTAGGKKVVTGGAATYTDAFDGKTYLAGRPSSVVVEYKGPMRATVCAKGRFVGDDQTKLGYIARVTVWAGRSDVHVKYTLANSNPDHYCYRQVKDSSVGLKLAGKVGGSVVGAAGPLEGGTDVWLQQTARVYRAGVHSHDSLGASPWLLRTPGASEPGGCKAAGGGKELWSSAGKGDIAQGWLLARVGGAAVWVDDLYFADDPPRRLAVKDGSLALSGVCEPLGGAKLPTSDKYRWLFDCSHLSSQYVLDFQPPATGQLPARHKAVRGRLWVMAAPNWYFQTEALPVGRFGTQGDELACYDRWGWKYNKSDAPTTAHGRMSRVPRWVAGDDNHFTSEQDTADALLLMYLRTGRRSFFDATEAWVNYFVDLQTWRTNGWRWKDGGTWKFKRGGRGPLGNRPQRGKDPVTGQGNGLYGAYQGRKPFTRASTGDLFFLANAKACKCHNWGEGLAEWYCLTGDRDAYEAAIDTVEHNYDTQRRAFGKTPGQPASFSRDFTRACYLTNATRLIAPTDPLVVEASDYLTAVYLKRPDPEPRGLLNGPSSVSMSVIRAKAGAPGVAAMNKLGVTVDEKTGELVDPKSGARWKPVIDPGTWMYPPLSRAMGLYYRITGDEDALDWVIGYGQAVARVLFQEKHGNLSASFLVDFPLKGIAKDHGSWMLPKDARNGEGVAISGYLGQFYPDVPARAYTFCGEAFLKQRAYDFWYWSSHRGHGATKMHSLGKVGRWVNCYSTHDETVCFTGRMFYEWAHPRADTEPPPAVADLGVTVKGPKAQVTFTAPPDHGGGKVVRYQVKCADRPILDYRSFLKAFADNESAARCNWWMATNLTGEPAPARPGAAVSFEVTGVPAGAKYFAVRSFDDSGNRSAMSNVLMVR